MAEPESISQTPEWQALVAHHAEIGDVHLRRLFADDPDRGDTMTLEAGDLYLDYAKHRLTSETIDLLVALARRAGVEERRDAMFADQPVNIPQVAQATRQITIGQQVGGGMDQHIFGRKSHKPPPFRGGLQGNYPRHQRLGKIPQGDHAEAVEEEATLVGERFAVVGDGGFHVVHARCEVVEVHGSLREAE